MATYLWSSLTAGSTIAFNANVDVLSFDDPSISASERNILNWSGNNVTVEVANKANAALNKLVNFTINGGGAAVTDTNFVFINGSKLLVGDNTTSFGSAFDDAANNLTGTAFNDRILPRGGNDTVDAGPGNDVIILSNGSNLFGNDTIDGGAGLGDSIGIGTSIFATSGVTIDFGAHTLTSAQGTASFTNIENAFGTMLNDTFIAFDLSRIYTGLSGSTSNFDYGRTLEGFAGNDTFIADTRAGFFEIVTYAGAPSAVTVNLQTGVATDGYDSDAVTPGIQPYTDTLVGIDAVQGSAFDDVLLAGGTALTFAGNRFEQLEGMGGNDTLNANGHTNVRAEYANSPGAVTVNLGTGTASDGWGGTDTLIGIAGVRAGNFNDTLIGDAKNNYLEGRAGNDTLDGGAGFDTIFFSSGSAGVTVDLVVGSADLSLAGLGIDTWVSIEGIRATDFNDTLTGDAFNNSFEGLAGSDSINGQGGNDRVIYNRSLAAVNVNLASGAASDGQGGTDTLVSIEQVRGSKFDDTIVGNNVGNDIEGWAGNDTIDGGTGTDSAEYFNSPTGVAVNLALGTASDGWGGIDTLISIEYAYGSAFNDSLTGDAGNNFLRGGLGADYLNGGAGADYVDYISSAAGLTVDLGNAANNTVGSEAEGDVYISIERIRGSAFNDTLVGNSGDNSLRGGGGSDILNGGAGHDFASYADAGSGIRADLSNPGSNTGEAAGDTYISIESLAGSKFNDMLVGDGGSLNFLQGGAGADTLDGGAGFDYADYFNSPIGLTVDLLNPANNTVGSESEGDVYISIERIRGSAFNDTLVGDNGSNVLRGGLGADILNGGAGFDVASYSDSSVGVHIDLLVPAENTGEGAGDTFISIEGLRGSNFNDDLVGDNGNNFLNGGPGGDIIDGDPGFDFADYFDAATAVTVDLSNPANNQGEAAGDTYFFIEGIRGGAFNDTLIGDAQQNSFIGGAGGDLLNGGAANGGREFDSASYINSSIGITASLANTALNTGEAIGDIYISIEGLLGSAFNDTLIGDAFNNTLRGNGGQDVLNGGGGFDFVDYNESGIGLTIDLANPGNNTVGSEAAGDTFISIEGLSGTNFNDILIGDGADNFLRGRVGADALDGGAGFDFADYFTAGFGFTADLSNAANNTGDAAGDTYTSIEALAGGAFNDILTGDGGDNFLRGREGADVLNGGGGNDVADYRNASGDLFIDLANSANNTGEAAGDTYISIEGLRGGDFDDFLRGNAGANKLDGGAGFDYASYINAASGLVVDLANSANNTGEAAGDTFTAILGGIAVTTIEALAGSMFNDTLTGDAGDNDLRGNAGADVLNGGAGSDSADYSNSAIGLTVDLTNAANNTGDAAGDTYTSIEQIGGSAFNDILTGNAADNFLYGELGNDKLTGGAGIDTAVFNGRFADYKLVKTATGWTVTGADGTDTLITMEFAQFDDDNIALTAVVTEVLTTGSDSINRSTSAAPLVIDAGAGDDSIVGGLASDKLLGGTGNDALDGGAGNDKLNGGVGDDTLIGGTGDNLLDGGEGTNDIAVFDGFLSDYRVSIVDGPNTSKLFFTLNGLEPGDVVNLVSKDGRINRMAGVEKVKFLGDDAELGVTRNELLKNAPVFVGAQYFADKTGLGVLKGTTVDDILDGLDGNDALTGLAGNDVLDGGDGNDSMAGGVGNDTYVVDSLTDTVTELANQGTTDTVKTALASLSLATMANVEKLEFIGTGDFAGTGNTLGNTIKGGAGNDTLDGGTGVDRMEGGAGDDSYFVDRAASSSVDADGNVIAIAGDTVYEGTAGIGDSGGTDTVNSTVSYTLGVNAENLVLLGTANISGTGNTANNVITGNSGNNTLSGMNGNDTLDGGAGKDGLVGGAGDDVLVASTGDDTFTGGLGSDTLNLAAMPFEYAEKSLTGGFRIERPNATTLYIIDTDTLQKLTVMGTWGAATGDKGIETFVFSDLSVSLADLLANTASLVNDTYAGGDTNDTFDGLAGNDSMTGGLGNDTLAGGLGNDTIDGGEGDDSMSGGAGNDIFTVDSAADVVTELLNQGTDLVKTTLSTYTLGDHVDKLEFTIAGNVVGTGNALANTITSGAGDDSLSGGAANDTLVAKAGNDTLDGGTGVDRMEGGAGDDTYYVDRGASAGVDADGNPITIAGDTVYEGTAAADSGGTDTVFSSVTYTLVLNVETLQLTGVANLNGTGNAGNNTLTGNDGNNNLSGVNGNDLLTGGLGNDTLSGGAGDDSLVGGAGKDMLNGGLGVDFFDFTTALDASTNVDTIADFLVGTDKIRLESDIFGLVEGALEDGAFVKGVGANAALDESDRIIYDTKTGALYYDADGSGNGSAAVQFAILTGSPDALSAADFAVI